MKFYSQATKGKTGISFPDRTQDIQGQGSAEKMQTLLRDDGDLRICDEKVCDRMADEGNRWKILAASRRNEFRQTVQSRRISLQFFN